jgi:hypothetical protein
MAVNCVFHLASDSILTNLEQTIYSGSSVNKIWLEPKIKSQWPSINLKKVGA